MPSRNEIEELKAKKRELEEQIKVLEEEIELPKVYDPKTASSYKDYWVGTKTTYKVPNLKSGTGYTEETVDTAYRGTPESQGYISVWESRHKAARQWCVNNIKSKIGYHQKQQSALLDLLDKYDDILYSDLNWLTKK